MLHEVQSKRLFRSENSLLRRTGANGSSDIVASFKIM